MSKIAVIVLNWKQPQLTLDTINSFLKIKHSGFTFQIILVDNGSPDNSLTIFRDNFKNNKLIKILKTGQNLGYAGGNNFGIKWALRHLFSHILIVNNDVIFDPNFLNLLFSDLKKNPYQILAPKIYFAPGFEYHKDKYQKKDLGKVIWALGSRLDWDNVYGSNIAIDEVDHGQYDQNPPSPDFISGCCFLVNSQFFKDIGLFDEKYYLYLEDADLSMRAKKQNYTLKVVPSSAIWHVNSGSSSAGSSIHDYFITRNRMLFSWRYARLRTKFAVIRESLFLLIKGRPWQKRGIIDYYLGHFSRGSWK